MKIFEKRPLALILCIMLGGFSLFADFSVFKKLCVALVSLLIIGIIFIFDTLKTGRKPIIVISIAAFSLSLLLSAVWSIAFFPTEYYGESVTVDAKIINIDNSSSSTSSLVCKTSKINGKQDRHTLILYVQKEEAAALRQYDVISFSAQINEFSQRDDGFEGKSYYISNGYSAHCNDVSEIQVKDNKVDAGASFLYKARLKICNTLKLRTNFDTGALLSALIVGDRSDLSGNIRLNFARLGISHILALSGMHLAILTLALNFLCIKIGIKKKLRVSVLAILVLFYMGLTGFSASVLRSGIMLIISGMLYLLATKADGVTSLFISVGVIVAINPVSVYDTSLWLSAFATLGVIVYAEIAQKADKTTPKYRKMLIALKNACLISVFAFCSTFVFVALRYDSFSVVSVFTTIIFSFIIQLFIYGGLLLLLFGGIIPFGRLIVLFSDAILYLAEAVSSIRPVYVSMNFFAVKALIVLLTVFFFAFLILDMKNRKSGVAIIVLMLVAVFAVAEIQTTITRYRDDIIYAPHESGDVMLLKSRGEVSAVYSGKAYTDCAWDILDYFADERLTYVDNLIFASYSYSTVDFVNTVAGRIKVEKIMLPIPTTDDEIDQAEGLSYLLSGYGTSLEFYDITEYVSIGEYKFRLFEKVNYSYGEYPANVYEVVCGDQCFTYLSVCKYEDLSASAKALIWNSKNLLIGTIGNSNYYIFDMRIDDIENIYYYDDGRLTDDAEKYYKEKGASVICTRSPVSLMD